MDSSASRPSVLLSPKQPAPHSACHHRRHRQAQLGRQCIGALINVLITKTCSDKNAPSYCFASVRGGNVAWGMGQGGHRGADGSGGKCNRESFEAVAVAAAPSSASRSPATLTTAPSPALFLP